MGYKSSKFNTLIICLLIINSFFYHNLYTNESNFSDYVGNDVFDSIDKIDNRGVDSPTITRIGFDQIPGIFMKQAFFAYNTFTGSLDADGPGYELVNYNDIPGQNASLTEQSRYVWGRLSGTVNPPPGADIYYLGEDYIGNPYQSIVFSPEFQYETDIQGNVHYLVNLHRDFDGNLPYSDDRDVTLNITLWHHNSTSHVNTQIKDVEFLVPKAADLGLPPYTYFYNFDINMTLDSDYTIPAGDRLKITYEAKMSNTTLSSDEHMTLQIQRSGSINWNIVDGIYSSSYSLIGVSRTLGVQLYMTEKRYPDINVYTAINGTTFQNPENFTVDVTDNSNSKFRWNGGSWTIFYNSTWTLLPTAHGWNYLEVQANDPVYDSKTIEWFQIGYDASITNVELNNFSNGSRLSGGYILDFEIYDVTSVTYEWDLNGTQFPLPGPHDVTVPDFEGDHNITIYTTDFYTTESVLYYFSFDIFPPSIVLKSPGNDTLQALGKSINVEINDSSGVDVVEYKWDSGSYMVWTPLSGNLYRTYLPTVAGWHYLNVTANDTLGNTNLKSYRFFTDPSILNVELYEMINESYYLGGETVKLTVTSSNGTIKYQWDNGIIKNESEAADWDGSILTLSGSDALPSQLGVHNLTILTGDSSHNPESFIFIFTLDQEAPKFDSSVYDSSNVRYQGITTLYFIITDNFTLSSNLQVWLRIDYGFNLSIVDPFELPLVTFFDGNHSVIIYVRDIAGNYNVTEIFVIIDNTAPDIDFDIPQLVNYLHIDGNKYVPADALVIVTITEPDPTYFTYSSINGLPYQSFIDTFTLGFIEGQITVTVRANDSLGNTGLNIFNLILDNSAPEMTLQFPFNVSSEINEFTPLRFNASDLSMNTIDRVDYQWDIIGATYNSYPDAVGYFEVNTLIELLFLYEIQSKTTASLSFELEDIVGNIRTYYFNFSLDYSDPEDSFYIYNEESGWDEHASLFFYVKGNTSIEYNDTQNPDIDYIEYYWDGNDELYTILTNGTDPFPWIIFVPTMDGEHNLTITMYDDTGEYQYPNIKNVIYFFKVDDINITFIDPLDFSEDYTNNITINYKENFSFTFNVSDSLTGLPLNNLTIIWEIDPLYNLSVAAPNQIDNITYEITITVFDVTLLSDVAEVIFYIWQFDDHNQSLSIAFTINKKEGNLILLESDKNSLYYDQNLTLSLKLNDDLNLTTQDIITITVNGTSMSFTYNSNTSIAEVLIIIANFIDEKGDYTFEIYAESSLYYDTIIDSSIIQIELMPIPLNLVITVSNTTILIDTPVTIRATLTYSNGTVVREINEDIQINFYIFVFYEQNTSNVYALPTNASEVYTQSEYISAAGLATITFQMNEDIDYIVIYANFTGNKIYDFADFELEEIVETILPPIEGIPTKILIIIIVVSVLAMIIVSYVVYKITRPKPFEQVMNQITDEEIAMNFSIMSPGVILTIFDQKKGPIPIVTNHSLQIGRYTNRMRIGIENFLLKISDQAYSSLGFEEQTQERRTGSIRLPGEKMIGFIHGVQLENKMARGGFENLSLIVLADSEYSNFLLNYQEFMYDDIDKLASALKDKKPLKEVEELIEIIRKQSVVVMLTAQKIEVTQDNNKKNN